MIMMLCGCRGTCAYVCVCVKCLCQREECFGDHRSRCCVGVEGPVCVYVCVCVNVYVSERSVLVIVMLCGWVLVEKVR